MLLTSHDDGQTTNSYVRNGFREIVQLPLAS